MKIMGIAMVAVGMLCSIAGCTANVEDPTVDQTGRTGDEDCVTVCDDTRVTCVGKCSDDTCKASCQTTYDDCKSECD